MNQCRSPVNFSKQSTDKRLIQQIFRNDEESRDDKMRFYNYYLQSIISYAYLDVEDKLT